MNLHMRRTILAALVLTLLTGDRALSFESVYTDTRRGCAVLGKSSTGRSWRCRGPAGYSALFSDEGNVAEVEFGQTGSEKNLGDLQWQAGAQAIGPKIEWRMRGGKPVSAILRIMTTDENGVVRPRLLVAKVTHRGGCLIQSMDAQSRDANLKARIVADKHALTYRCKD